MTTLAIDLTVPSTERFEALVQLQKQHTHDIPFIDPQYSPHIPQWSAKYPIFFAIELINRGVCVYCLLRFLQHRHDPYYLSSPIETINSLFPSDHAPPGSDDNETQICDTLEKMKEKLLFNAQNDICTVCIGMLNPQSDFINFMLETVDEADYQFDAYHIQRTLPATLALKQFGLWHYLKHTFGKFIPFLFENQTGEGAIIELKEIFKLYIPQYTTSLNESRTKFHSTRPKFDPLYDINGNINADTVLQSNECNFITSRYEINKNEITFDMNSPFHIDIFFYTTSPEYANTLHNILFKRDLFGEFAVSSNTLKSMSSMGLANMKAWSLSPPQFSSSERIPLPTPLNHLIPTNEIDSSLAENGFYTENCTGIVVNQPVPFLPKQLLRYPSTNEFNARTFMLNKYLFVQVSCKHNPVWLQGTYCKKSRMLSQTSWYRDLSFYQKDRLDIPQRGTAEAHQAAKKNSQFAGPDRAVMETLAEENQPVDGDVKTMGGNSEAPVQYDPKRKRRNFEHSEQDEERAREKKLAQESSGKSNVGKKNAWEKVQKDAEKVDDGDDDVDEVVSLSELDPLFTGCADGIDDFNGDGHGNGVDDDDDDEQGFGAMIKHKIQQNKEREQLEKENCDDENNDDKGNNNNNNNNKNTKYHKNQKSTKNNTDNSISKTSTSVSDNPNEQHEDDIVGQGSLPYAESSVENEICFRILPYFHSVNRAKVGFNVKKNISKDNFEIEKQTLSSPAQLFNNHDTVQPSQRYAGYCSLHSTNPNGIPCTHYHREALPGPIELWKRSDDENNGDNNQNQTKELGFNPYRLMFHANYGYKFHSSGREDLNVRMLGDGRPFLIEILDPHRIPLFNPNPPTNLQPLISKTIKHSQNTPQMSLSNSTQFLDLSKLLQEVNAHSQCASLTSLDYADEGDMDQMTKGIADKRKKYRCVVHTKKAFTASELGSKISTLGDVNITQNTPVRVLLRRAALPRQRHINNIKVTWVNPHFFYLDLETQAGTYVKEFVHGDKGRTNPSISAILDSQCDILQLDVSGLIL
jgi:tRNA U54 and U55 pseudouridine synthase Pus10